MEDDRCEVFTLCSSAGNFAIKSWDSRNARKSWSYTMLHKRNTNWFCWSMLSLTSLSAVLTEWIEREWSVHGVSRDLQAVATSFWNLECRCVRKLEIPAVYTYKPSFQRVVQFAIHAHVVGDHFSASPTTAILLVHGFSMGCLRLVHIVLGTVCPPQEPAVNDQILDTPNEYYTTPVWQTYIQMQPVPIQHYTLWMKGKWHCPFW